MPKKKKKDAQVVVRMEEALKSSLEKEADAEKRSLGSYVCILLETHPKRQKPKS